MPCNNTRGCNSLESATKCCVPERVCIQAQRVFDACISQLTQESASIAVTFPTTQGVTFVSAQSAGVGTISNVVITPQAGSVCSRIQYTIEIPVQVVALDASGNTVIGTGSVTLDKDILLRVPREAVVPTEVQCTANLRGVIGTLSGNTLTLTYCATLITKVVAEVELLVQSYGYPALPACQDFAEDVCTGVFNLPLYPC